MGDSCLHNLPELLLGPLSSEGWAGAGGDVLQRFMNAAGGLVRVVGGRPPSVFCGPLSRTVRHPSVLAAASSQSESKGEASMSFMTCSKVTHSQCCQFPTGYTGLPVHCGRERHRL